MTSQVITSSLHGNRLQKTFYFLTRISSRRAMSLFWVHQPDGLIHRLSGASIKIELIRNDWRYDLDIGIKLDLLMFELKFSQTSLTLKRLFTQTAIATLHGTVIEDEHLHYVNTIWNFAIQFSSATWPRIWLQLTSFTWLRRETLHSLQCTFKFWSKVSHAYNLHRIP